MIPFNIINYKYISIPTKLVYDFKSKSQNRASLVVQSLRICLSMQGTRVRALVWEGSTCRGATRPVSHNY